tara:strand:- start:2728 stop:2868 length:141 start_codon:yes stop_codon:yes gene_type:complete
VKKSQGVAYTKWLGKIKIKLIRKISPKKLRLCYEANMTPEEAERCL